MTIRIESFVSADCVTSTYGTAIQHLGGQPAVLGAHWGYRRRDTVDFRWPFERLHGGRMTPCDLMSFWYGLEVTWTHHPDWESAWRQVRETLDLQQPAIVVADAYHLPYCWQYGKQHSPHRVVLTGYTADSVEISDGYRGSLHRGFLPLAAVRDAVTSSGLVFPRRLYIDGRNTVIAVAAPGTPLGGQDAAHIREILAENVGRYVPSAVPDGKSGYELLLRCAAELRAEAVDLAGRTTDVAEVSAWLGGVSGQRVVNSVFLRWAAETLSVAAFDEHAEAALALSRHWEKIRNYFYLRLSAQGRPIATVAGRAAIERVADLIEEAAEHELSWCRALGDESALSPRTPLGPPDPDAVRRPPPPALPSVR